MRNSREPVTVDSPGAGRIRRRLAARLMAASPIALVLTCFATIARDSVEAFVVLQVALLAAAVLSPIVGAAIRLIDGGDAKRPAKVSVVDDVLKIEGTNRSYAVPVSEIESGWYVPSTGTVEIVVRHGDHVRAAMKAEEADALLRAARADVTQRTHVVPLRGVIGTPVRALLGGLFASIPGAFLGQLIAIAITGSTSDSFGLAMAIWLASVVLAVFATVKWFGAPRLVVGADGIRALRRFVPYSEITQVSRTMGFGDQVGYHFVRVGVRNGPPLVLPVIGQSSEQIDGLVDRIETGQRAARRHDPEAALEALARNGRSMEEWRRDLESLLRGAEGYRRIQITREELLSVLENAGARAEYRLTAAVALSVLGGADDVERIRVAAGATANERVRVALDRVATGDIDDGVLDAAAASERSQRA